MDATVWRLALVIALGAAVTAGADDSDSEPTITVYRPTAATDRPSAVAPTVLDRAFERVVSAAGMPVTITRVPVRRAYSRFGQEPEACVFVAGRTLESPMLQSDVFSTVSVWPLIKEGSSLSAITDLKTVAIVTGFERWVDRTRFPGVNWLSAPDDAALATMVLSGRADAMVTGPRDETPPGITRLPGGPIVSIEASIGCKPTALNQRFIESLNAAIARLKPALVETPTAPERDG